MPPRFHAPTLDPRQPTVTLPAGESLHLARVLRLAPGALVDVFDGEGRMLRGAVAQVSPAASVVQLTGPAEAQPEAPWPIVVCAPLLKGDAMDAVVRDATVLGAQAIVPVTTRRTNVPMTRAESGRLHARWQRVAVAAAKQCGRARLPTLGLVEAIADVWERDDWQTWQRRVLVEPSLGTRSEDMALPRAPLVLTFGPEGGWEHEEVSAALTAGWQPWSLGEVTLRAEHVTLAALAIVRYTWSGTPRT